MTRHRTNAPRFVDETVDGEVLIMDMIKGTYFSCVGASTVAFNALKDGANPDDIAAAFADAFDRRVDEMREAVDGFAADLRGEEIMILDSANGVASSTIAISTNGVEYEPLQIERFDDLADLILLDPVHDVSEAGWPTEAT
jgi:hypothetical protein